MRTAAIDCGTNSIRLLIADVDGGAGLTDVVRLMRVVRLGEGVDATGTLSEAALDRTFKAVDEYAALIKEHDAGRIRFVATSATRDASNRDVFVAGVRDRLGVEPEVVSGDEEAELSFSGAASVLAGESDAAVLVVDLGGGSTEFVVGTGNQVIAARSMDMGCVRFTERFLRSDPPTEQEIAAAEEEIGRMIDEANAEVNLASVHGVIGVAGSITTVTAHALRLPEYQPERIHGTSLTVEEIDAATTSLLHLPRSERAALPYMHPGRVDVIGAGALIWRTIVRRVADATQGRVQSAAASEHDILDGIALSAASRGERG
ncbi:Ppx/GppA phosphatase family protein [Arthrobacter tumbae]|uniref:Ppx/GppA phosphatase family protein n=1 Tax=Arthrobacter tumbae TaxID=163874 RepID=UPI00195831E1|nr:Ppx/GppA phosphatase family protein [Arthrobacter tumbae]MBM7782451.1 exopolyphosphatase/guanosine-5'-triphosphate,3'-diphosphate pyrophosphatase [Arthrobacter tumbae]